MARSRTKPSDDVWVTYVGAEDSTSLYATPDDRVHVANGEAFLAPAPIVEGLLVQTDVFRASTDPEIKAAGKRAAGLEADAADPTPLEGDEQ